MDRFLNKHQKKITGNISVFDRVVLKGYLPITYPSAAESFFSRNDILLKDFKDFTTRHTMQLKEHAIELAKRAGRPYEYVRENVRKDEFVRGIMQRDNITDGLICVLAITERNKSFALRYGNTRPCLQQSSPQCLTLYFYYLDRQFGFMHVRLSTWMPFNIQVYCNGHDWLERQLATKGIAYTKFENAFSRITDCGQAQKNADRFPTLRWVKILDAFARRVNPLLKTILKGMDYYWVIDQAEYATDIMCCNREWLDGLYQKWQRHAAVCFQAVDIMRFMGRKLPGQFNSDIVTNLKSRPSVTRIKHSVRGNWIKMYNKNGIVLRIETVINCPQEFRLFKLNRGKKAGGYEPMRKRVTNMVHYAKVSLRSNSAYLNALADVNDPTEVYRELNRICEPVTKGSQRVRPLNPLRKNDRKLFEAVVRGEHHLHGFKSNEIGKLLGITYAVDPVERKRQGAKVSRKIKLLYAHGLITRRGRSRRYRVTGMGMRHMNAAISLYEYVLPAELNKAA